MEYKILDEKIVFNGHYKVIEAKVEHDTFRGAQTTVKRLAFERGDSVAILLLEKESQHFLFANQFRYPTCKHDEGWLIEIVAGELESGESPTDCIKREVLEELGYVVTTPQITHTFYTSPGGCTERLHLFYAEVSKSDKKERGGGAQQEDEDIEMIRIPKSEISEKLHEFKDAKTILAIQWYLLHKFNED